MTYKAGGKVSSQLAAGISAESIVDVIHVRSAIAGWETDSQRRRQQIFLLAPAQ